MNWAKLRSKSGMALVFLAIIILALLSITALVIDLGRLYVAKQRAQADMDAAAIGGAWELNGTNDAAVLAKAESVARKITDSNNAKNPKWQVENVVVTFPTSFERDDGTVVTVDEGEAIGVECEAPVQYGFARVFGLTEGRARALAIAVYGPARSLTAPLVPWVVADTTIWENPSAEEPVLKVAPGEETTLKVVNPNDPTGFVGPGNFLCCAYEGDSGGDDYRERIEGFDNKDVPVDPVTLETGDTVDLYTEPGNMIGPTYQGLSDRLARDTVFTNDATAYAEWSATYDPETKTCDPTPRIVLVPIVEDPGGDLSGRKEMTVVGFAAFFIESFDKKTGTVTGRFVTGFTNGEVTKYGLGGFGNENIEIMTVQLVK